MYVCMYVCKYHHHHRRHNCLHRDLTVPAFSELCERLIRVDVTLNTNQFNQWLIGFPSFSVVGVFLFCWTPFFTLNIVNAMCLRYNLVGASSSSLASVVTLTTASPVDDRFNSTAGVSGIDDDDAAQPSNWNAVSGGGSSSTAVSSSDWSKLCDIEPWMFSFLVWLGYINSFLNPVIYTIFNAEFRRAFSKILHRRILRPFACRRVGSTGPRTGCCGRCRRHGNQARRAAWSLARLQPFISPCESVDGIRDTRPVVELFGNKWEAELP